MRAAWVVVVVAQCACNDPTREDEGGSAHFPADDVAHKAPVEPTSPTIQPCASPAPPPSAPPTPMPAASATCSASAAAKGTKPFDKAAAVLALKAITYSSCGPVPAGDWIVVAISGAGRVDAAAVRGASPPAVARCVEAAFGKARFPRFGGPCKLVAWPLR